MKYTKKLKPQLARLQRLTTLTAFIAPLCLTMCLPTANAVNPLKIMVYGASGMIDWLRNH